MRYRDKIVIKSAKQFAEKLNQCLDETDAPPSIRERTVILSKMLDISKQEAWNFLEGLDIPDHDIMQKIAHEFEVDLKWLEGDINL